MEVKRALNYSGLAANTEQLLRFHYVMFELRQEEKIAYQEVPQKTQVLEVGGSPLLLSFHWFQNPISTPGCLEKALSPWQWKGWNYTTEYKCMCNFHAVSLFLSSQVNP